MPLKYEPQLKASMFGRMPVGGDLPKGKGGIPPYKGPKGVRAEHRIGVHAPAQAIWEIIRDLEHWREWNPLYPEASGEIHIGATLDMTVQLPGMKPQAMRATVLDWVPNEQLHYEVKALGGLVRAIRFIEIEQLAPESCIVSNGEIMGGFLGRSVARQVGSRVLKGLRLMNEALKDRAEARLGQAKAS
jgi:hypothetical protein